MVAKAAAWQPTVGALVEVVRGQWSGLVGVVVDARYDPHGVVVANGGAIEQQERYGVLFDGERVPLTFARSYLAALQ